MKKALSLLTLLTVLSVPSIGVFAASTSSANNSGSAAVLRNKITTAATTSGGITEVSAGGGTWTYGFTGALVFSQYDNDNLQHRSSVQNSNSGSLTRSEWVDAEQTAYIAIRATLKGNQAFWATRGE